jgi:flagellar biosynthesis/type III secretory pathway chaperone
MTMAHQDQIADILSKQIEAATQLQHLLSQERKALEGRDLDHIDEIIQQKQAQVSILDDLERQRGQLVQKAGFDGKPEMFSAYLEAEDHGLKLTRLTDQLKAVLSECFQLNRVNGGIAELSYHYLNQSLAVLRGTGNQLDATYGPQGKPVDSADSQHTIAKA